MLDHEFTVKSLPIRRLQTGWIEAGERGRPVLFFCHGFPDSPEIWSHQIESLSKKYRVIAPFVRGCMRSEPAEQIQRYGREAVALDHLAILAEATDGHESVIVIGHDLGVVHGFSLARKIGERLKGIVVLNGLDIEMFLRRLKDPSQLLRSWYMGLMQLPLIPEALVKWVPATASWLAQSLAKGDLGGYSSTDLESRALAALNQYRAFARESLASASSVARIKAPVLVIWGRDDGVLMPPTQPEWDRVALNATIRIIPGGHWLHRDQHEGITAFIDDFAKQQITEVCHVE